MTKADIIAEILAKPLVLKQVDLHVTTVLADGTKMYAMELLEVLGNSATIRNISFIVIDDGLPTEVAYYRDVESTPQIQNFMSKLKPLLKQYNASILEKGETWALCKTHQLIDNAGIFSLLEDTYLVVDGDPLVITKIG